VSTLSSQVSEQELNQLLVYGNNFLFSVKKHLAGRGHCKCWKISANIVYTNAQAADSLADIESDSTNKTDENISADMEADTQL